MSRAGGAGPDAVEFSGSALGPAGGERTETAAPLSGETDAASGPPSDVIHAERPERAATAFGQDEHEESTAGPSETSSETEPSSSLSGDDHTRTARPGEFIPSERSGGAGTDTWEAEDAEGDAGAQTPSHTGVAASESQEAIIPEAHSSEEASVEVAQERPAGTEETPARKRFARDADSNASRSGPASSSGAKSRGRGASSRSSGEVPIARYDSLTAAEVVSRLRNLSQRELARVERYEKGHEGRQTVLSRIDSLREDEPWRGYDDATVNEVRRKLAGADEERAKAVRDYERRHRDRKGVMDAARRTVAST